MSDNYNEEMLMHYGIKFRSGRYKFGSGERPYQHDPSHAPDAKTLAANADKLQKQIDGMKKTSHTPASELSDEELKEYNKRASLERAYENYNKEESFNYNTVNEFRSSANTAANAARQAESRKENQEKAKRDAEIDKIDLSGMSSKELQESVNRMRLEKQYKDMLKMQADTEASIAYAEKGRSFRQKVLENADVTLSVAGLALTGGRLALELYKLTHSDENGETFKMEDDIEA